MSDEMSTHEEGVVPAEEPAAPEPLEPPMVPEAPPAPEAEPAPDVGSSEMPPGGPVPPPPAPAPEPTYAPTPPPPPYTPPPPPPYTPPVEVMPQRPGPATESSKMLAALSYLFPIIAIVVLFVEPYKDEKFVKFHAVQAIVVGILYVIAGAIAWIPIIGWILWIVPVALAIMGLVKAFQGEYWEMPVAYPFVKSFIGE